MKIVNYQAQLMLFGSLELDLMHCKKQNFFYEYSYHIQYFHLNSRSRGTFYARKRP